MPNIADGVESFEDKLVSIIDDDELVRDGVQELVESFGYRVVTFNSAEDFLASGLIAETACLITDLQMPGLSGLELQETLRSQGYQTPVILITGYPTENHRKRALNGGTVAFLSKPFNEEKLIKYLTSAIRSRSSNRQVSMASTTSIDDSGLPDDLLPIFKEKTGVDVKAPARGMGHARASLIILGVVALTLVVWQGVQLAGPIFAHPQDETITVFAAASMKNALDEVDADFTKQTGIKVVSSYDASSALIKQIEGGAAADAFVSADLKWMDYGVDKKVINESTRINLLGNVLVLIAAKDAKIDHVDIEPGFDLAKLADGGRIATGDVDAVPVGLYAKAALEKLGVWASVEPKMEMAVNVRAALAHCARREALLGIVYATDAKIEPAVKVVGIFPDKSHDPIVYPVAATVNAKPGTIQYLTFLQSAAAKSIFEGYGFSVLAKPTS